MVIAFGLPIAMTMSAVALIVGGFVWLMIPETIERRRVAALAPAV
jgi:hypothetical protein